MSGMSGLTARPAALHNEDSPLEELNMIKNYLTALDEVPEICASLQRCATVMGSLEELTSDSVVDSDMGSTAKKSFDDIMATVRTAFVAAPASTAEDIAKAQDSKKKFKAVALVVNSPGGSAV